MGLVLAMLLETVLLILRTNCSPELGEKYAHLQPRRRRPPQAADGVLTVRSERGAAAGAELLTGGVSPAAGSELDFKKDQ